MSSRRAIVIGGSIAGLCAARALAEHFERVTIVERDVIQGAPADRKGVPQSRHPHGLLDRGRQELDALFPGFSAAMRERGALDLDPGMDLAMLFPDGWAARQRTKRRVLFASRFLIESVIRELAGRIGRIELREGVEVTGLVAAHEDSRRVAGVAVRDRSTREEGTLDGDVVVDASGRGSRAPEWLAALDLPPVEREVIDADAGYSSCWFDAPPPSERPRQWWWQTLWLNPVSHPSHAARLEDLYFGVIFPIEGNRWIVTMAAWGGRPLPKDRKAFEALAANLRSPLLVEAIEHATPLTRVLHRRGMQNIWNHYERWTASVSGFLAIGDGVCAFNPIYGQGMSSAAACASILRAGARRGDPTTARFARGFFRRQAEFLRHPWSLAVARDRQVLGEVADSSNPIARLAADLFAMITRDGIRHPTITGALFDVFNLNRTPASLLVDPWFLSVAGWQLGASLASSFLGGTLVRSRKIPHEPPAAVAGEASWFPWFSAAT